MLKQLNNFEALLFCWGREKLFNSETFFVSFQILSELHKNSLIHFRTCFHNCRCEIISRRDTHNWIHKHDASIDDDANLRQKHCHLPTMSLQIIFAIEIATRSLIINLWLEQVSIVLFYVLLSLSCKFSVGELWFQLPSLQDYRFLIAGCWFLFVQMTEEDCQDNFLDFLIFITKISAVTSWYSCSQPSIIANEWIIKI